MAFAIVLLFCFLIILPALCTVLLGTEPPRRYQRRQRAPGIRRQAFSGKYDWIIRR